VDAHLAYLESGAKCIISSSYQATMLGFNAIGYNDSIAESLIIKSILLAEDAIKRYTLSETKEFKPLIAASIGPYGAYLADGSEYHGNYNVSDEILRGFHTSRIKLLDNTNADFFACETIPSFQEAKVLSELLVNTNKSAWISFSCKDESHINDGTLIEECVDFFSSHANVFAIGVNCTAPKYISGLIKSIKRKSGSKKIVIYPNSGEVYFADTKTWSGVSDPNLFAQITKEWIDLGADIVGGCCRIGTEHIKGIDRMLGKTY